MLDMTRRADAVGTVSVAIAGTVALGLVVAGRFVVRYGDWMFSTPGQRIGLVLVVFTGSILVGAVGGWIAWQALRVTAQMAQKIPRRWLWIGAFIAASSWLTVMNTRGTFGVYGKPFWLAVVALSFLFVCAAARGKRPILLIDSVTFLVVILGFACLFVWLNLSFIRQAESSVSNILNSVALMLTGGFIAAELAVAARVARPEAASPDPPSHNRVRLWGTWAAVALAALAVFPSYRIASSVSLTESPPASPLLARSTASSGPGTSLPRSRPKNLILISIDTLRADHLGIYGYEKPTSPNIDRFFAEGVKFEAALSQAPWTLPSHMSMITGQYVSTHGSRVYPSITRRFVDLLPDEAVTLAEVFSDAGFVTGGFTASPFLSGEYGFDQGFDAFAEAKAARMQEVLDTALPWLRTSSVRPFFLFLHCFDVHRYNPPKLYGDLSDDGYQGPIKTMRMERPAQIEWDAVGDGFYSLDDADVSYLEFLYDSEIRNTDEQLDRLFTELETLGLIDGTAVVLTSDHGESFYEHGSTGHAFTVYNEALHVPLLIRHAASVGTATVREQVRIVDLMPTLLDLFQVPTPAGTRFDGVSLVPSILGEPVVATAILGEADALDTQATLIMRGYKYINYGILSHDVFDPRFVLLTLKGLLSPYAKNEELYNLEDDPAESRNLAKIHPEMTEEFRSVLMDSIRNLRADSGNPDSGNAPDMTRELEQRLRSLGYVE